jgi:hypothetical protein
MWRFPISANEQRRVNFVHAERPTAPLHIDFEIVSASFRRTVVLLSIQMRAEIICDAEIKLTLHLLLLQQNAHFYY